MTLSFASVSFLSTFAATVFWGLSLLCFLFSRSALKEFKQSSLFKPVMSIALFEIAHSIYISHQGNQEFFTIFSRYDNWVQLVLFIPMAYFIKHTQCQKLFTLLAFSSFMLAFLMNSDTHQLILMRLSERSGFGWPAIGFGLYASIMLLGLLCFFSNLQNYFSSWPNHKKKLAWCTYGLANVLLILGLIQCQSRGAYLAFIAGLIVIIFSLFKQKNITLKQHYKLLFPIIILSTVIGLNYSSWSNRLLAEQDTLKLVVQGKIDNLPESSIGLRISLWECGLENWIERPLFGHGAGTNKQIIQQCPQPNLKGTALKDFHNTYIEILSAFGVSGLILWLLFYIRCFNSLNQCHQKQTISLSWLNFLYASLTTVIIWNFFDFRMVHTDYRFFWLTLTAIIGSFCLNNKPQYE